MAVNYIVISYAPAGETRCGRSCNCYLSGWEAQSCLVACETPEQAAEAIALFESCEDVREAHHLVVTAADFGPSLDTYEDSGVLDCDSIPEEVASLLPAAREQRRQQQQSRQHRREEAKEEKDRQTYEELKKRFE